MKKILSIFVLSFLMMQLTSCASVINGSSQRINVDSTPDGATVYIDGSKKGVTPMDVKVKRKRAHELRLAKDGYQDERIDLRQEISAVFAGNAVVGGPIGLGVDMITGAQYKIVPEDVYVEMTKSESAE